MHDLLHESNALIMFIRCLLYGCFDAVLGKERVNERRWRGRRKDKLYQADEWAIYWAGGVIGLSSEREGRCAGEHAATVGREVESS